jgi:hypothetical protein
MATGSDGLLAIAEARAV